MDSMMDLWKGIEYDQRPTGRAALETPSSQFTFRFQQEMTIFKTPCVTTEEYELEDSGYSTACTSTSSIESGTIVTTLFKTPCCPTEHKFSKGRQKILPEFPIGFKSKIGLKQIDVLACLSCVDILDLVLKYLSPDDLVRCSQVSKTWNSILKANKLARTRKSAFLSTRRFKDKENLIRAGELPVLSKTLKRVRPAASSTPLATISSSRQLNFCTPSLPPVSPSKISKVDKFNVYQKAGSALKKGESQMCCPRCRLPATKNKDINLGLCSNGSCQFQFCLSCLCENHLNTACLILQSPEKSRPKRMTVKSYRRNIRRLL